MKFLRGFAPIPLVLCVLTFLTATLSAQDLDDVEISGKVVDSNNLSIVGAIVMATLVESGVSRTFVTADDGRFRIIEFSPGLIKVSVSAIGFGPKELTNLQTLSGQKLQLNFKLDPADVVVDPVQVTDDNSVAIDTTRTVVGGVISGRDIEEIPNSSRNPLDLVFTLGGTSEEALSVNDLAEDRNAANGLPPTEQGNFSLSGGASFSNNITIDGLDNNDDRTARDRFQPSLESIVEVQVITNQFSAEYGRASGGRVNLRTRAGSNKFRGRAFMFFRDDNLNANTYFNNFTFFKSVLRSDTLTYAPEVTRSPLPRLPLTQYNPGSHS